MTTRYIYALIDPRTNEPRYVGATQDPEARLASHVSQCPSGETIKDRWLRELKALGLEPELDVIDKAPEGEAPALEAQWIQRMKQRGYELVNSAPAGGGKLTDKLRGESYHSIRITAKTYEQANELKANGYESLTNALSVAVDPKEKAMEVAQNKSGNGLVVLKEGDLGYIVTVSKGAMPPHYSKEHATYQEAAADFARLARQEEEPMTIYISNDAESWGAEPTEEEIAELVKHAEQVAEEWTRRPVEVKVVDEAEAFTKGVHNDPLAAEIAEAAWNRMFA